MLQPRHRPGETPGGFATSHRAPVNSSAPRQGPRRVIGIDPGSIRCGIGVVERDGNRVVHIYSATVQCGRGDFSTRLTRIYGAINEACTLHSPDGAAIEGIFHHRNADSALKLGHARGVAMLALAHAGLSPLELSPAEVKKSIGAWGRADKDQVQAMVRRLIGVATPMGLDESDALAIAIAGLYHKPLLAR